MASKRLAFLAAQHLRASSTVCSSIGIRTAALSRSQARPICLQEPFGLRSTRLFSGTKPQFKEDPSTSPSTIYGFIDIASLSSSPQPNRILIDVREVSELQSTGTIPTAQNVPIKSAPDAFFLNVEDFEDKYGFPRPGEDDEVVFFCKSGVRSKAAAQLAGQAGFGGRIGEYPGSWQDWEKNGGKVEKVK